MSRLAEGPRYLVSNKSYKIRDDIVCWFYDDRTIGYSRIIIVTVSYGLILDNDVTFSLSWSLLSLIDTS